MARGAAAALASFLVVSAFVGLALGSLDCEDLAVEDCAFSVSGSGARCVLEKRSTEDRGIIYECQTSTVVSERAEAWIETNECLSSCGLQRMSVGISTDGLSQREFLDQWCSLACQNNCPNIVNLFNKIAADEDINLAHVCGYLRPSSRRLIGISSESTSKATLQTINMIEAAMAPEGSSLMSEEVMAPEPSPF